MKTASTSTVEAAASAAVSSTAALSEYGYCQKKQQRTGEPGAFK
jgi:hypothetical protein